MDTQVITIDGSKESLKKEMKKLKIDKFNQEDLISKTADVMDHHGKTKIFALHSIGVLTSRYKDLYGALMNLFDSVGEWERVDTQYAIALITQLNLLKGIIDDIFTHTERHHQEMEAHHLKDCKTCQDKANKITKH